jgi:hypothetical protein
MKTPHLSSLSFDALMPELSEQFAAVTDKRSEERVRYSISDTLKSAFAMFSLKSPSLLNFRERTRIEDGNLQRVYGIGEIPGDTQMRAILDEVPPEALQYSFAEMFAHLKSSDVLDSYRYEAANGAFIASVDGVSYFSSAKVHCPCCTVKQHRDGKTTYSHAALCAVIVHPQKAEVFPLGIEPILHQDGSEKNDCEQNAAKRLLEYFRQHYASEKLLFVEDALYANAPHIRQIQASSPHWQYLLAIKPLSHKGLFERFAARKKNRPECVESHQHTDTDGTRYRFEYANDLALSESASDIRVNVLHCTATTKKGKTTTFTWITNIKLHRKNVYALMKAGRARWKIENETFNTLKNQGYHFEHNYGHGNKHLSALLATLMLLAFLVDQMQAAADTLFKKVTAGLASKMKFWEALRAVFKFKKIESMHDAFRIIAVSYEIQRE